MRGARARHVVAFERRLDGERAIVLAPRLLGGIVGGPTEHDWAGTSIQVDEVRGPLRCAISGKPCVVGDGRIEIADIPLALLTT